MIRTPSSQLREKKIACDDAKKCATLVCVQHHCRTIGCISLALIVAGCNSPQVKDVDVKAARESIFWSQQLLPQSIGTAIGSRPSAILGTYVSLFLSKTSGLNVRGAKTAVNVGVSLLLDTAQTTNSSYELLQSIGTVMQVDIQDMLNRSPDRREALDAYIGTLEGLLAQSAIALQTIEQQEKNLQSLLKTQSATLSAAQRQLNTALSKQDYTSASARQQEVITAQAATTKTQTESKQMKGTIEIFKKLNTSATQRLAAIKANRQALIAGIRVENVPGIDSIGVLQGTTRRGGGLGESIFGDTK